MGYPGWHIECSGISMKYLGEDLDIHCGGIDNAFPHHTNEIAQSESYLGHPWCKYWMHVKHLTTPEGKVSKSKATEKAPMLTVSLLEEKGYDPLAYRLFCLQSHYRKELMFSWENLDNAQGAYQKLIARIAALTPETPEVAPIDDAALAALREKFRAALDNDLNTSLAVTALYDVLKAKTGYATRLAAIEEFDSVLGLKLLEKAEAKRDADRKQAAAVAAAGSAFAVVPEDGTEDPEITAALLARRDAKKAKNFAEASSTKRVLRSPTSPTGQNGKGGRPHERAVQDAPAGSGKGAGADRRL